MEIIITIGGFFFHRISIFSLISGLTNEKCIAEIESREKLNRRSMSKCEPNNPHQDNRNNGAIMMPSAL